MMLTRRWRTLVAPVAVAVAVLSVAPACTRDGPIPGPTTTVLGEPGDTFVPFDINDRGQVLGVRITSAGESLSLHEGGRLTTVTPLGEDEHPEHAYLNERGDVVATIVSSTDGHVLRNVFWRDGRAVELGTGATGFKAARLDDQGNALLFRYPGTFAEGPEHIIWREGVVTPVPSPPEGFRVFESTSDGQLVTGTITRPDGTEEAAVWRPGGPVIPLGAPDGPGGLSSVEEVTDTGFVVGREITPAPGRQRLFIWHERTGRVDLGVPHGIGGDHQQHYVGVSTNGHVAVLLGLPSPQEPQLYLWRPSGWTRIGVGGLNGLMVRVTNQPRQVFNDRDQLLLTRRDPSGLNDVPVVWSNGRFIDLRVEGDTEGTADAVALNRRGQVIGSFAVGEWPDQEGRGVIWTVPALQR